ncbi:MAG: hypothetical protein RIS47_1688 [Bacteroidota bacterium]|jgi:hypothetical protein
MKQIIFGLFHSVSRYRAVANDNAQISLDTMYPRLVRNAMQVLGVSLMLFLLACDTKEKTDENKETHSESITIADTNKLESPSKASEIQGTVPDRNANTLSHFLAGISSDYSSPEWEKKAYYKQHKAIVEKEWAAIEQNNLLPIKTWARENNVTNPADTLTMIYPFSGPDFLYANAFFPYCKNYIMIGLEKAGSMPDMTNVPDSVLSAYLENIRYSLRYINKKGYFVTTQMQKDFNKNKLDGTLHIMLYYLARMGNTVISVNDFFLDKYGKAISEDDAHVQDDEIQGIRISFTNATRGYVQDIYYFPFDLSDANVAKKSEFLYFVNSFGPKIFYTKSASYILHDSKFSTIRKLLLDQSQKVLQDDTGIPYFLLDNGNFRITLFGDYTRTINDFDNNFQPGLKEALNAREKPLYLPFKIGYNAWFNETVLIYGQAISAQEKQKLLAERSEWRKQQTKKLVQTGKVPTGVADAQLVASKGVLFRIQIVVSEKKLVSNASEFKGLSNVGYFAEAGKYHYTIGNASKLPDLTSFRALAKGKGFKDAFVVAFKNGARISMSEALDTSKK